MLEEIRDLQSSMCAIIYHLYRQAGCPFGDNLSGMSAWLEVQREFWLELNMKDLNDE